MNDSLSGRSPVMVAETKKRNVRGLLMLGILLLIVGNAWLVMQASCLSYTLRVDRVEEQSRSWSVTEGRIYESRVDDAGDGDWQPVIGYEYTAGGIRRTSQTLAFGEVYGIGLSINLFPNSATPSSTSDKGLAWALTYRYPVDMKVPVYYDPSDPDMACLIPGPTSGIGYFYIPDIVGILMGLGALIAAIVLLIMAGREIGRSKKSEWKLPGIAGLGK